MSEMYKVTVTWKSEKSTKTATYWFTASCRARAKEMAERDFSRDATYVHLTTPAKASEEMLWHTGPSMHRVMRALGDSVVSDQARDELTLL